MVLGRDSLAPQLTRGKAFSFRTDVAHLVAGLARYRRVVMVGDSGHRGHWESMLFAYVCGIARIMPQTGLNIYF